MEILSQKCLLKEVLNLETKYFVCVLPVVVEPKPNPVAGAAVVVVAPKPGAVRASTQKESHKIRSATQAPDSS